MNNRMTGYEKKAGQKRRRWRKRFARKAAAAKYRRFRLLRLLLLSGIILFLTAAGSYSELWLSVREERTVELRNAGGDGGLNGASDLYRIIFRMKSGVIEFHHEKVEENPAVETNTDTESSTIG